MSNDLFPKSRACATRPVSVLSEIRTLGYYVSLCLDWLATSAWISNGTTGLKTQAFTDHLAPSSQRKILAEEWLDFLKKEFPEEIAQKYINKFKILNFHHKLDGSAEYKGHNIGTTQAFAASLVLFTCIGDVAEKAGDLSLLLSNETFDTKQYPMAPLAIDVTTAEIDKFEQAARSVHENRDQIVELFTELQAAQIKQQETDSAIRALEKGYAAKEKADEEYRESFSAQDRVERSREGAVRRL